MSLLPFRPSTAPRRRLHPRSTLPASTLPRSACMPPSLVYYSPAAGGGWWQRLMFWLLAPSPRDTAPPPNRLAVVKREFAAALADVDNLAAEQLRWRVQQAHSLRDLWHLRSDLYHAISVTHSQAEAEARLILVNAHFPTRAPRSQFAPL